MLSAKMSFSKYTLNSNNISLSTHLIALSTGSLFLLGPSLIDQVSYKWEEEDVLIKPAAQ